MKSEIISCNHCFSKFQLTSERINWRDTDELKCEVCGQVLYSWSEAKIYTAMLIERGHINE